jgi:hypothetical protein
MTAIDYSTRLAEWAVVFPSEHAGIPNVDAEQMTALEAALQELRETRRPISDADRVHVTTAVPVLLHSLGVVKKEEGAR